MDLRKWLIPCVLALALVVPVARAADKPWDCCQRAQCVAADVCAAAEQTDDQTCCNQSCNCFFKTVIQWLHLDSLCGCDNDDDQPAAGQEEEGCDPEVVHPQAHLHIQILVAPCPWAQLGQFQIFRMIRPGRCQVPQENSACPINDQPSDSSEGCPESHCWRKTGDKNSSCADKSKMDKQENDSSCDDEPESGQEGCCVPPFIGCERRMIEHIMTPPQEMFFQPCAPAMMPGCPLPAPVFAGHTLPCCPPMVCCPPVPSPFSPMCPTAPMSPMTAMSPLCPMGPMGPLTGTMPFCGVGTMPPMMPTVSPLMQSMALPCPPCPMPQPCLVPMVPAVPQAEECLKACVRSGKICLQVPGCDALKVSAEDLNVKLADGREWSCSVTEDGKISIECDGDKSECTFAAEADRLSIEQDNNKVVLEGGVTLRYRWKDGKTGGLVEAERCCFDVTTGAMQIETACKHLKKSASCPVERARYCPLER
jgi:hypothetical protein